MVLYGILRSIFTWTDKSSVIWEPMKIIKSALIWGVLIQLSRFIMSAMIDISTIATYSVGWLPMSVLKESDLWNRHILGTHSNFSLNKLEGAVEKNDSFQVWYSYGWVDNISKCKRDKEWNYIVWRANGDPSMIHNDLVASGTTIKDKQWTAIAVNKIEICVMWYSQRVVFFVEEDTLRGAADAATYKKNAEELLIWKDVKLLLNEGKILTSTWYSPIAELGVLGGDARIAAKIKSKEWLTVSNMISRLKWLTGPLITIYSSVLNFADMADIEPADRKAWWMWVELLIKLIFALALIIPLALLAIVLIARVGLMRLYIIFSPILIVVHLFKDTLKLDLGNAEDRIDPWNIAWIIFAPVIIVFSISISLIFMTAITETMQQKAHSDAFYEYLWAAKDKENGGIKLMNLPVTINQNGNNSTGRWDIWDTFSWILVQLFAIWLIWAILMWAIKATKLGKAVVKKIPGIDTRLQDAAMAVPLFSVKNKNGENVHAGLGAMWNYYAWKPGGVAKSWERNAEIALAWKTKVATDDTTKKLSNVTDSQYTAIREAMKSWWDVSGALSAAWLTMAEYKWSENYKTFAALSTNDTWSHKYELSELMSMSKTRVLDLLNSGKVAGAAWWTAVQLQGWENYTMHATRSKFGGKIHYILTKDADEATKNDKEKLKKFNEARDKKLRELVVKNTDKKKDVNWDWTVSDDENKNYKQHIDQEVEYMKKQVKEAQTKREKWDFLDIKYKK